MYILYIVAYAFSYERLYGWTLKSNFPDTWRVLQLHDFYMIDWTNIAHIRM